MAGIVYTPTLAQVLGRGNVMDTDIVPDAANTRSLGTTALRLKNVVADKVQATDGADTLQMYHSGGATILATDNNILYISTDGLSSLTARLILTNTVIQAARTFTPTVTASYDLGLTDNTWRDLHLSRHLITDISNYAHQEYVEHFLQDPYYYIIAGSGSTDNFISTDLPNQITASRILFLNGTGAYYIQFKRYHNPANYTYYQCSFKFKFTTALPDQMDIGPVDFDWDNGAFIDIGTNASTIKFRTLTGGGAELVTDNIACVMLNTDHVFTIKIKAASTQLFIDDVLVATHATNNPYNVTKGIAFQLYRATGGTDRLDIDYVAVQLGRAF